MKKHCSICGCSHYNIFAFKSGQVCENCLRQLKADVSCSQVRIKH